MPIRRTFRRLWTLVTGRGPARAPTPSSAPTADDRPTRSAVERPPSGQPVTAGIVQLRLWSVGPYAIVAGTPEEAARALDRLATERSGAWDDRLRQVRATLKAHHGRGDGVRVAV